MRKVFICYRRAEAEYAAGALGRELRAHFGEDQVFRDKEDIGGGEAWKHKVLTAIGRESALLVLIGPRWLETRDASSRRRIDDSADPIRMELQDALRDGAAIIPVLLENASMPAASELPPELAPLAEYNALKLHDSDWQYNLDRILRTLEKAGFKPVPGRAAGATGHAVAQPPPARWSAKALVGAVLVGLTLVGLAAGDLDHDGHVGAAVLSAAGLIAGILGWRETGRAVAKGRGLAITVTTLAVVSLLASIGGLEGNQQPGVTGQVPGGEQSNASGNVPEPAQKPRPTSAGEPGLTRIGGSAADPQPSAGESKPMRPVSDSVNPTPSRDDSPPAQPAVADVSGSWKDDENAVFEFEQHGSIVQMAGMSEGVVVQGTGTITGRRLRMQVTMAGLLTVQMALELSGDGHELRGTLTGPEGSAPVVFTR
jgi:TIR domain